VDAQPVSGERSSALDDRTVLGGRAESRRKNAYLDTSAIDVDFPMTSASLLMSCSRYAIVSYCGWTSGTPGWK
jgi:hypothetical protein